MLYIGLVAIVLAGPFFLHQGDPMDLVRADRHLVVITPHDAQIRAEIGGAFIRKWKADTGETLDIDWRIPGGSSEIIMLLKSEYLAAFRDYFERAGNSWSTEIASGFTNNSSAKVTLAGQEARRTFLNSDVGIGIDVIFGGGASDYQQLADAGYLVAGSPGDDVGFRAIRKHHPDWFNDKVMPSSYSGEQYRDPEDRWVGVLLASFGIIYNTEVYQQLGDLPAPRQWPDLADPRLEGYLALADPTKSGSVAKAFELMIQQQMVEAFDTSDRTVGADAERRAIDNGWIKGLQLIQRLAGNARYFTDSAGKIGLEVARGDAAAGMAIDSYGRVLTEFVEHESGSTRVRYVIPARGTSLSVDPVAMLRGAPHPELATAFLSFLLSSEGQKLWALKPGVPDGPKMFALRRFPVRRDIYSSSQPELFTEGKIDPYERISEFVYHPNWTQSLFSALRFMIRVMCIDPHDELREAWQAIIRNGMDEKALAAFHDMDGATLDVIREQVIPILKKRDKISEMALSRQLAARFRAHYVRAKALANGEVLP